MWANWTDFLLQTSCLTVFVNFATLPPVPPVAKVHNSLTLHIEVTRFHRFCLQNASHPPLSTPSAHHPWPWCKQSDLTSYATELPPPTLVLVFCVNFLLRSQRKRNSNFFLQCKSEPSPSPRETSSCDCSSFLWSPRLCKIWSPPLSLTSLSLEVAFVCSEWRLSFMAPRLHRLFLRFGRVPKQFFNFISSVLKWVPKLHKLEAPWYLGSPLLSLFPLFTSLQPP